MIQAIRSFCQRYVRAEDSIILGGALAVAVVGFGMVLHNAWGARYTPNPTLMPVNLMCLPLTLMLFVVALYARDLSPRLSLVAWFISVFYFIYVAVAVLMYGTQLTPYQTIDTWLVGIDQRMAFDQLQWLHFTYRYHWLAPGLNGVYGGLLLQVIIVPLALAMLGLRRSLLVLYMAMLCTFVAGTLIYYFYPSTAPASVFDSPYFTWQQHNTFVKFYELHYGLPNSSPTGGMIAFPSFHVIWAALFAYAFKDVKYLRLVMGVVNVFVVLSTIMLGWHYLIDVVGGLGLAAMAVVVSEWLYMRYMTSGPVSYAPLYWVRQRYRSDPSTDPK